MRMSISFPSVYRAVADNVRLNIAILELLMITATIYGKDLDWIVSINVVGCEETMS